MVVHTFLQWNLRSITRERWHIVRKGCQYLPLYTLQALSNTCAETAARRKVRL